MNQIYIYYVLVLKEYLGKIIGAHYPTEIIGLIIMATYKDIYISCGPENTIIIRDRDRDAIHILGTDEPTFNLCKDIRSVICGWDHTIAMSSIPNELYVWGENEYGQLGLGHCEDQSSKYSCISFVDDIKAVSCGYHHTIALLKSGICYVWGRNEVGQLGLGSGGDYNNVYSPQELKLRDVTSVTCGEKYTIALTNRATCYVWGRNEVGQLGLGPGSGGDYNNVYSPQELKLRDVTSVTCGEKYTIALVNKTKCYVWGHNRFGQLGLGHNDDINSPQDIYLGKQFMSVSCGSDHTVALMIDQTIYVWGNNNDGELGLGDKISHNTPQQLILTDQNVISICCGRAHTMALTKEGQLYAWGFNSDGQLGIGHVNDNILPQKLKLEHIRSVYCGTWHTIAVSTNSDIYGWGWNREGQLGLGDEIDQSVPTKLELNF